MTFGSVTEICRRVLGPLVRFRDENPAGEMLVRVGAEFLQKPVRFWKVLAVGAFTFEQIGDCVKSQPVNPERKPVIEHLEYLALDIRTVEVEVGLMGIKPVPVIAVGNRIVGPVRGLEILKNDPGLPVFLRRGAPHIVLTCRRTLFRAP